MQLIDVKTETETERSWTFEVDVTEDGDTHSFSVTLNWSDYDLWSHGRIAPEKVAKAVMEFLLKHESVDEIFRKFDCAVIRRYFPQVDRDLPGMM
jgi:hypothetical protein